MKKSFQRKLFLIGFQGLDLHQTKGGLLLFIVELQNDTQLNLVSYLDPSFFRMSKNSFKKQ